MILSFGNAFSALSAPRPDMFDWPISKYMSQPSVFAAPHHIATVEKNINANRLIMIIPFFSQETHPGP